MLAKAVAAAVPLLLRPLQTRGLATGAAAAAPGAYDMTNRSRSASLSIQRHKPPLPPLPAALSPATHPSDLCPAVYVVFGATGGIGSSLAQLLGAQAGAQLLLSGRDEERLQAASSAAAAAGAAAVAVAPADPLDVAAVEAVMNDAVKRYGRVDGVANCVGSVILKSGGAAGVGRVGLQGCWELGPCHRLGRWCSRSCLQPLPERERARS